MTKRISIEAKEARQKMRLVSKETERLLDRVIKPGSIIYADIIYTQVALNLGLPVSEVREIVLAYISAREDLYIYRKSGGITRRPSIN
jgi:hypothetical protein